MCKSKANLCSYALGSYTMLTIQCSVSVIDSKSVYAQPSDKNLVIHISWKRVEE